MSKYDPPMIGSIITAARAVAIVSGLFCLVETVLAKIGRYTPRRHDERVETLSWVALSLGVVIGGTTFLFNDFAGIENSSTFAGQLGTMAIWSLLGLGFVTRAAGRAAQPLNVFLTGSAIFFTAITISIVTGLP